MMDTQDLRTVIAWHCCSAASAKKVIRDLQIADPVKEDDRSLVTLEIVTG